MKKRSDNSGTRRTLDDPRSELLSRAYRDAVVHAPAEPPRSIDDAVRAAARQAVEAQPRSIETARHRVLRRWRVPLALAATTLLAIGIALKVYKTKDMEIVPPSAPTTKQGVQPEPIAKKEAEKLQQKIEAKRGANEPGGAPSPRDAARSSEGKEEVTGKAGVDREYAVPPSTPADQVPDRSAESGAAQAPQPEERAERQERQPVAKPFPGAPTTVLAPPPPREPAAVPSARVPAQTPKESAPGQSRSRTQGMEQEKAVATPPTAVELLAKRLDGRPPEAWTEEIRNLKRAGRGAEAAELLDAFRKKFPNFALPDDLK